MSVSSSTQNWWHEGVGVKEGTQLLILVFPCEVLRITHGYAASQAGLSEVSSFFTSQNLIVGCSVVTLLFFLSRVMLQSVVLGI